ncbi:hypothetical protein ACFS2C_23475 [Prauserella oleivorans]|uniref:Flp pilus-assembly TadG-like N-terminal domain-containing protein n=1 Tax=Prauserella oleivorans TaxID=1478153 RepID=A0ABW5WFU5_9PSEU|nr:hypothetical protein [Prauserella muralis]
MLIAVLVPALLFMLALVVDGAGQLRATARADAIAAEAARAAQTALDTRGATVVVDPAAAVAAAHSYLSAAGENGEVSVIGPRTVRVTVTIAAPAAIGLIQSTHHATGTATAELGIGTDERAQP